MKEIDMEYAQEEAKKLTKSFYTSALWGLFFAVCGLILLGEMVGPIK